MGGIGKTTVAAKLFNSLLPGFGDAACFLEGVRDAASHAGGLVELQQRLLKALTQSQFDVENVASGPSHADAMRLFSHQDKKMLLFPLAAFHIMT